MRKKSLVVVTVAVAATIALSGCSQSRSSSTTATVSVPTSTPTSPAQVKSLNDAVAYALAVTTTTPVADIEQRGKLLKQYTDASTKLTSDQKSAADGFLAQSQQAVAANDATGAGSDLEAAAQGVLQALSGD